MLVIFYGGKMVVFDDFPAEKAEELMKVVGGSSASPLRPPPYSLACQVRHRNERAHVIAVFCQRSFSVVVEGSGGISQIPDSIPMGANFLV
jgi:hypothetical protein